MKVKEVRVKNTKNDLHHLYCCFKAQRSQQLTRELILILCGVQISHVKVLYLSLGQQLCEVNSEDVT